MEVAGFKKSFSLDQGFDPNMAEDRVGTDQGPDYLKGWVNAHEDTFQGVNHVCSVELQRG
jgi:hypothetical protein